MTESQGRAMTGHGFNKIRIKENENKDMLHQLLFRNRRQITGIHEIVKDKSVQQMRQLSTWKQKLSL